MSERALLERFDLVANNPENIPLLRRYIVNLAIRGKLLEKPDVDIPAPEMLLRIEAKADSLIRQGKIKKQKALDSIRPEELAAPYTARTMFERLGSVANLQKGLTGIQSATPGEFPLVTTATARSTCDHYDFDGAAAIVPMVSSTGHGLASLNRLHYQEGKFALGTILCAVFPIDKELVSARFLFEYLMAFKDELLVSKMTGTANVTLTIGKIAEVPVPIIASAVQHRVDELMSLCDQLEAAKIEREKRRDRLVAASLQRLNQPVDDEEIFRKDVNFTFGHLPCLTTRPAHIKQLRQTILNLAVRGRLVEQDPKDEPAAELLKQIQTEKIRLVKIGEIRREKNLPSIGPDKLPFEIPKGWEWTRIRQITSDRGQIVPDKDFTYIDVTAINKETGCVADAKVVTKTDAPSRARKRVQKGDVLYSCVRPYLLNIAVIERDILPAPIASTAFAVLNGFGLLHPKYQWITLRSPFMVECVEAKMRGQAYPAINDSDFAILPFPLPPLAEQRRIVAKVDELMALCDQLEAQLIITNTNSRRVLEAVLQEALSPAFEKNRISKVSDGAGKRSKGAY